MFHLTGLWAREGRQISKYCYFKYIWHIGTKWISKLHIKPVNMIFKLRIRRLESSPTRIFLSYNSAMFLNYSSWIQDIYLVVGACMYLRASVFSIATWKEKHALSSPNRQGEEAEISYSSQGQGGYHLNPPNIKVAQNTDSPDRKSGFLKR